MPIRLTLDQQKALDVNRHLAITAGAGSGKTTVLVNRYLHVLLRHPELGVANVLAITFTEKAAAEMKERIFREIHGRFAEDEGPRQRLFAILQELHDARIFTIHAFCNQLLRRYAIESGVSPDFTILTDLQLQDFLENGFQRFFQDYDSSGGSRENELAFLNEFSLPDIKRFLFTAYYDRAIVEPFLQDTSRQTADELRQDWKRRFLAYHRPILQPLLTDPAFWADVRQLTEMDPAGDIRRHFEAFTAAGDDEYRQLRHLIDLLNALTTGKNEAYRRVPGGKKKWGEEGVRLFQELSERAAEFAPRCLPLDPAQENSFAAVWAGFARLAADFLRYTARLKEEQNLLDFEDLQLKTVELLEGQPHIRQQLQRQYPFILVDEFQDTDILQSRIVSLLCDPPGGRGKLFVVGDPKQSIFGFRHADVHIFQNYLRKIASQSTGGIPISAPDDGRPLASEEEERRGIIRLSDNFRSTKPLIDFFNLLFREIFNGDSAYEVPFEALRCGRTDPFNDSVIELELFREVSEAKLNLAEAQATALARKIHRMVREGSLWVSPGGGEPPRPARYRDMAVLLRGRTHLEILETAFRRAGIPYQTYKGKGFFRKQEVQDLYYLLRSLADPDDDYALHVFLRSEFAGLSDAALFYISQAKGRNSWEKLRAYHEYLEGRRRDTDVFQPAFATFLANGGYDAHISSGETRSIRTIAQRFSEWRPLALNSRFSVLLEEVVEELQIRPLLAAQPEGEQKLANLDKFLYFVHDYQTGRSALLADLLDTLEGQIAGQPTEGEATVLREEADNVQIITYHSAKGMEFPVVFLPFLETVFRFEQDFFISKQHGIGIKPGISGALNQHPPFISRLLKQDERDKTMAEEKRLLYVAATRARDHLFLYGALNKSGSVPENSYLGWLWRYFRLDEELPEEAADTVLSLGSARLTVRLHRVDRPMDDWPGASSTGPEPADSAAPVVPEEQLKYQAPRTEPPGGQIYSATQLMLFRQSRERYFQHFYLQDRQVTPPQTELEYMDEPGGALWGSAVHKLLEDFPARPAEQDDLKIEQILAYYFPEQDDSREELRRQLAGVMKRVRISELADILTGAEQYSEYAVDMRLGPFVLRGIFDRLFRNRRGQWEIIDFKTNRITAGEIPDLVKKYQFQMQVYALLLAALHPEQDRFPVSLYFLTPMQAHREVYSPADVQDIRRETRQLAAALFELESRLLNPAG